MILKPKIYSYLLFKIYFLRPESDSDKKSRCEITLYACIIGKGDDSNYIHRKPIVTSLLYLLPSTSGKINPTVFTKLILYWSAEIAAGNQCTFLSLTHHRFRIYMYVYVWYGKRADNLVHRKNI